MSAVTLPVAPAGHRNSSFETTAPAHLDPHTLLDLFIFYKGNISAIARFVDRSPTTVRRHLEKKLGYGCKRPGRQTWGSANPMAGRKLSAESRREISEKVRESTAARAKSR